MNPALDDLLDAWCDGVIDDAGQAELDRLIAGDPLAARRAALAFDQHRGLRDLLRPAPPRAGTAPRRRLQVRRWIVAAAGMAAAALLALALWPPAGPAAWIEGDAVITAELPVARADGRVEAGDRISAHGAATLRFRDGTALALEADTRLAVLGGVGKALRLDAGVIRAQVAPQPADAPLTIATPHADLTVVGTVFRLETGGGRTALAVEEGGVRLVGPEIDDVVRAGASRTVGAAAPPVMRREVLIDGSATWAFLDTGVEPAAGWSLPGFADAGWARGPAPLGFDWNEPRRRYATRVGLGGPRAKPGRIAMTTWFRHEFTVADADAVRTLTAHLRRDDGAALYLNGVEVARSGLPDGALGVDTRALGNPRSHEERVHVLILPPTALRDGRNCLAAEVHQTQPGSTDLLYALELVGDLVEPAP